MKVLRPGQLVEGYRRLKGGRPIGKDCDRLFSLVIRARDKRCRRCGTDQGLQCAHIMSRRYKATRFAEDNAIALCLRCHAWQTHHPLEGDAFFVELIGQEAFDALRARAMAGLEGAIDYQMLRLYLRQRLRQLEAA